MELLRSTGGSVRLGILVALVWAGLLWGWAKMAESRESAWLDARSEKLGQMGVEGGILAIADPDQLAELNAWDRDHPQPVPMPLWPDGLQWWAVVVGAYVCLVVAVQLKNIPDVQGAGE